MNDPLSSFSDELGSIYDNLKSIQEKTITTNAGIAGVITSEEYDFNIYHILERRIDPTTFESSAYVIGYIIDKYELQQDGSYIKQDQIILENANLATTIDLRIKYGVSYMYTIRSIAYSPIYGGSDRASLL